MNLKEFLDLPRSAVLIVTDEQAGLAWINYSTNVPLSLSRLYEQFAGRDLSLDWCSAGADIETLKLHTEYYRERYHQNQGYKELIPYGRKAIQYKVRSVPAADFKRMGVEIVTARGENSIVGVFKNKMEANSFIETYYGTANPFNLPVYAWNSDTKEFVLNEQNKLLKLT